MSRDRHPVLASEPTLAALQTYVAQTNVHRGHNSTTQACLLLLCEEVGELVKAARKAAGIGVDTAKPDDAHSDEEAADVLWLLLSVCNSLGINLEQALRGKEEKNKQRVWRS